MTVYKFIYVIFPLILFLFSACGSSELDIVEIEEQVNEPASKQSDQSVNSEINYRDIKQETVTESASNEPKFSKQVEASKIYTIQIGAFVDETNAINFINNSKEYISENVYYDNSEGMYKVRVGNISDVVLAKQIQEKIEGYGFSDSFIVVLKGKP